jgi:hypothetical protein
MLLPDRLQLLLLARSALDLEFRLDVLRRGLISGNSLHPTGLLYQDARDVSRFVDYSQQGRTG